jgi:tetratricopeptide (TPR) repeat protein
MWWNKKRETDQEKIIRILKELVSNHSKVNRKEIIQRIINETDIQIEGASQVVDIAIAKLSETRINVIKKEIPHAIDLPYSKSSKELVEKLVVDLAQNVISYEDFLKSIFDIQALESEDWLTKGEKLAKQKDINKALECLDLSLKFNQYNESCLIERGKVLQNLDFHLDAIEDFSRVIDFNSNDFSVIYLRGCSYLKVWELEKAETDFKKAIQLSVNANEQQTKFAQECGYDSVGSMYNKMLLMLSMVKDDDAEFVDEMKNLNSKRREI